MKLILTVLFIFYFELSFSQIKETMSVSDSISNSLDSDIILSKEKYNDSIKPHLPDTLINSIFEPVNKLDEVFIKSKSEFNAVSLGIL